MLAPLMPKATAVWLVDNTTLTFQQIADFCGLHVLEIQAIADGEIGNDLIGFDPISNDQLQKEELERCEKDPSARLIMVEHKDPFGKSKKSARYTPKNVRQDRPDAIAWMLKNYPNIPESSLCRFLGTTKSTIASIRDKTHWNINHIKPRHPVVLGFCSQKEFDEFTKGNTKGGEPVDLQE